jgi:hypothetical protein
MVAETTMSRAPTPIRPVPHDEEAERAALGIAMVTQPAAALIVETLTSADFYTPAHAALFDVLAELHAEGMWLEPGFVAIRATANNVLDRIGGREHLFQIYVDAPPSSTAQQYVDWLRQLARRRMQVALAGEIATAARDGNDPATTIAALRDTISTLDEHDNHARNVTQFLAVDDEPYDWLVPLLFERGDRTIVTGPEGAGKSTLCRQIAVQAAAGIDPFTLVHLERPLRVLIADFENSASQLRRWLRPLVNAAGDHLDPDRLHIVSRPEGLDLLRRTDRSWLEQQLRDTDPDLMVIGPLYKMAADDIAEEKHARPVALTLDELRTEHGCALLMEAHTGHAQDGGKRRPERPIGSSLWMRWPEFGLHLNEQGQLRHWRGARDERAWPSALKRGGEWPWTVENNPRAVTFAAMLDVLHDAGGPLSMRDLADRVGCGQTTVRRAIDANKAQWQDALDGLEP